MLGQAGADIREERSTAMIYTFRPQGVCAREMQVEVDDQGVIQALQVSGGCSGNLQGIAALVRGMSAREAVQRLKGIHCGFKDTSCPDQLAQNLEQVLAQR
jgi:uncharacterized protein (TIGR03905 family)